MMRITGSALAAAALAFAAPATAATVWQVRLTTDQEPGTVNPTLSDGTTPRPTPFGEGIFTLNDAETQLSYLITVFNLDFTGSQTEDINDNLTAAHIHAGPAVAPKVNGPVVFGFIGTPFNDNNPNDRALLPFTTGVGGSVSGTWDLAEGNNTTLALQIANLKAGRAYVNYHTRQFPGGEIRGDFGAVVPEPAGWAMMIAGFGLVGGTMRSAHRRKAIPAAG